MLAKSNRCLVPNCSNMGRSKRMWTGIRSLQVPPKEASAAGQKLLKHRFMCFADFMELLVKMKDSFDINLIVVILWMIWESRNSNRVGGCSSDLQTIRAKASTFLHDFSSAQLPRQVAVFKELGVASLGMVIRDSEGLVIGALAKRIPLPCSVAMMEVLACKRVVLFAKEMSIFEATVEGDAEIVISALKDGSTNNPKFGHII
nr:hypothetical protein CFP56_06077 [Quercus suber]